MSLSYDINLIPKELLFSEPIIEVGCGNGHFLVHKAKENPDKIFIGCDIKGSRVEKTKSKIKNENLNNAFIFKMRGEDLLSLFPVNSLAGFYMNFPDPWWKKRYHKRRFFYLQTDIDHLVNKLKQGGFISFISDHEEYFQHVFSLLCYNPNLKPLLKEGFKKSDKSEYKTMFALRWEKEGRNFYQTNFKKSIDPLQD